MHTSRYATYLQVREAIRSIDDERISKIIQRQVFQGAFDRLQFVDQRALRESLKQIKAYRHKTTMKKVDLGDEGSFELLSKLALFVSANNI